MRGYSFLWACLAASGLAQAAVLENCSQPVDIVVVQDTTETLFDDMENIHDQMLVVFGSINSQWPNSRFGVAEYKDKPLGNFGWEDDDYCYRLVAPLTNDIQQVVRSYNTLYASGGKDWPEAAYHALWNVIRDDRTGWLPLARGNENQEGKAAARIIVHITDAEPHFSGHADALPTFPATSKTEEEFHKDCLLHDYPSPEQIKNVVKENNITIFTLVGRDATIDAYPAYEWLNEFLEQPAEYVTRVADGSTDFGEKLIAMIMAYRESFECDFVHPTTVPPLTEKESDSPATQGGGGGGDGSCEDGVKPCSCKCGGGGHCPCKSKVPTFIFNVPKGETKVDLSVDNINPAVQKVIAGRT